MRISVPVAANRIDNLPEIGILRNKGTGRSVVIPRPEILQAGIIVVVLTVVDIAVQIIDVNCQRTAYLGRITERIICLAKEQASVLL